MQIKPPTARCAMLQTYLARRGARSAARPRGLTTECVIAKPKPAHADAQPVGEMY